MKKINFAELCAQVALWLAVPAFIALVLYCITALKSEIEPTAVEYYKASEIVSDNGRIYLAYDKKEVESITITNHNLWSFKDEGIIDNGEYYFIDICLGKDYDRYFTIKRVLYNATDYINAEKLKVKSELFKTIMISLLVVCIVFLLLFMGIDIWNDSKNFAEFQRQLDEEKQT